MSGSERRRQAVPSGTKSAAMSNPAGRTNLKKILERGFFYWGAGARRRTHDRGFGERKRTTPSGGPVRDEERSDEQSRRAHQFKKNPRKRIFLLGRIDFQFYFRLFSIALIAAGNCPNAVISASARVPQYSCSP